MEVEGNTSQFTILCCPGKLPLQQWGKAHSNENQKGGVNILLHSRDYFVKTSVMPVKQQRENFLHFLCETQP